MSVDQAGQDGERAEVGDVSAGREIGNLTDGANDAARTILEQQGRTARALRSDDPICEICLCHNRYYPPSETQV
jgi:hypothetical protein